MTGRAGAEQEGAAKPGFGLSSVSSVVCPKDPRLQTGAGHCHLARMHGARRTFGLLAAALLVLVGDLVVLVDHGRQRVAGERHRGGHEGGRDAGRHRAAQRRPRARPADGRRPPDDHDDGPASTTTTAPPRAPAAVAAPAGPAVPAVGAWTYGPYEGLGVWLDVYDWTMQFTNGHPHRARAHRPDGRPRHPDALHPDRAPAVGHRRDRGRPAPPDHRPGPRPGHGRGGLVPPDARGPGPRPAPPRGGRGACPSTGWASTSSRWPSAIPGERTGRLLELSSALRSIVGDRAISCHHPDAVHLQVVNPSFWPGFPWFELRQPLRRDRADGLLVDPPTGVEGGRALHRREHRPHPRRRPAAVRDPRRRWHRRRRQRRRPQRAWSGRSCP